MIEFLQLLLQLGGIAALVAGVVAYVAFYILRNVFEKRLDASLERELEKIKIELAKQNLYVQEIAKKQVEYYPGLANAVYRSRNAARNLCNDLPRLNAHYRTELGDLTFRVTEGLYETRAYLPRYLFDALHSYKRHLQNFIFGYDILTGDQIETPQSDVLLNNLKAEYVEIDGMCDNIVTQIQQILNVDK
jgi:hypothetical protein